MRLLNLHASDGDFVAVTTQSKGSWFGTFLASDEEVIVLIDPDHPSDGRFYIARSDVTGVIVGPSARAMHQDAEARHQARQQGDGLAELLRKLAPGSAEEPIQ